LSNYVFVSFCFNFNTALVLPCLSNKLDYKSQSLNCYSALVIAESCVSQIDGYLRRQRLSRGPEADDCCWRTKNTLATNCCLFWARFYGNHLLCIYVGIKLLYLANAILQVNLYKKCRPNADILCGRPLRAALPWPTITFSLTIVTRVCFF